MAFVNEIQAAEDEVKPDLGREGQVNIGAWCTNKQARTKSTDVACVPK